MRRVMLAIIVSLIVFLVAPEVYAAGYIMGKRHYYPGFSRYRGGGRYYYPKFYHSRRRSVFITSFSFGLPFYYPSYRAYRVPTFDKVEKSCTRRAPGRFEYLEVAPSFYEKVWIEGRIETYDCSYYVPRDP